MPNRRQAIIWINADLIHWCIYAPLGGDELNGLLSLISRKSYCIISMEDMNETFMIAYLLILIMSLEGMNKTFIVAYLIILIASLDHMKIKHLLLHIWSLLLYQWMLRIKHLWLHSLLHREQPEMIDNNRIFIFWKKNQQQQNIKFFICWWTDKPPETHM